MTISTTTSTIAYAGDGATTAFPVPFAFFGAGELEVVQRIVATGVETVQALTTNYTVAGGNGTTGTVTALVAPASTVTWTIRRKTDRTQLTDYVSNDAFPAESHERALDRLTAIVQEIERDNTRSFLVPKTDPTPALLPSVVVRASQYAGFNAGGDLIALAPPVGTTPVTPFMATVLDDNDAAAARATLGVTPGNLALQYRAPFLVNGGFDVWQNSTSLAIPASTTTSLLVYAADRWCMETSANQASVVSRQTGTGTARFRARVQRNAGQTGTTALRFQLALTLPEVIALRGRIVTVSCTAQAGANFSGALRMKILTGTGTAGRRTNASAYTSEATPLDGAMAITTSEALFSNVSTAISASATQAAIVFEWTPSGTAGAADLFEIQQVWLDFGAVAAAFPYEDDGATLLRCQKRFYKTTGQIAVVSNAAGVAQSQPIFIKWPATMEGAPSVVAGTSSGLVNANSFGFANTSIDGTNAQMNSLAAGLVAYTIDPGVTVASFL